MAFTESLPDKEMVNETIKFSNVTDNAAVFKRDFSIFNDDEFRKEVNQINWDVTVKLDLKDPNLFFE